MHYVILSSHSPETCPTSNAKTRAMMLETAPQIPAIAEKNGVTIVSGPYTSREHIVVVVMEADSAEGLDRFLDQSRLGQFNTLRILPSRTMEESMAELQEAETLF